MKKNHSALLLTILLLSAGAAFPSSAYASKTSSNISLPSKVLQYLCEDEYGGTYGWSKNTFANSYKYEARLYKGGNEVSDGATVTVGDSISLAQVLNNANITWVRTGSWGDTPPGQWVIGAAYEGSMQFDGREACVPYVGPSTSVQAFGISIAPPTPTYSFSGPCTQSGSSCSVTGAGTITATITFPSSAYSYYEDYDVADNSAPQLVGAGQTPGGSISFTVDAVNNTTSMPNLVAGLVSPTSATAGIAQLFSSIITNNGSVSTGSSFNSFMRVATAPGGGGTITDLAPSSVLAIAAGGQGTVSSNYTFATAGTYSMQACVDQSSSAEQITSSGQGGTGWVLWYLCQPGKPCPQATNIFGNGWTNHSTAYGTGELIDVTTMYSSDDAPQGNPICLMTRVGTRVNGVYGTFSPDIYTWCNTAEELRNSINTTATVQIPAPSTPGPFEVCFSAGAGGYGGKITCTSGYTAVSSGTISESNERDNCGPWTDITVSAASVCNLGCGTDLQYRTYNGSIWSQINDLPAVNGKRIEVTGGSWSAGSCSGIWSDDNSPTSSSDYFSYVDDVSCVAPPPPATPTNLTATPGLCGTGAITVSWTAVSSVTSYTLRDGATVLATTTSTTYPHTGLVTGSSHSYTVRANNSSGSSAYSTAVTGTAPSVCNVGPDLTAGTVSPTSATAGIAVTLSATITNSDTASTGVGFTDLFKINPNSIPTTFAGIQSLRTFLSGVLAAGASNTATSSFTFPSAGTWYVSACADTNTSNTGVITESNATGTGEGNNCSPSWTAVSVTSPGPAVNGSCPSPQVHYSCASGTSQTNQVSGVSPNRTWTWSCAGSGGGSTASCSEVETGGGCSGSLSPTITATPSRVQIGGTSDIAWTASGVNTSCVISGTDGYSNTVSASACSIPNGSTDPDRTINAQTTYCITCDNKIAEQKCVTVNVIPDFDEF